MFRIERRDERADRDRWVPEPGPALATHEEAATALREAVAVALRLAAKLGDHRTPRFRIALAAVAACLTLQ